jgi:hypothetical protein
MASAVAELGQSRRLRLPRVGTAERLFWRALALMAGLLLAFQLAHWVEREIFQLPRVGCALSKPTEKAMRFCTLPHFLIAYLFCVTAARNRTWKRQFGLASLMVLSVPLAAGLAYLYSGGTSIRLGVDARVVRGAGAVLATTLLGLYFLVHELRDEAFFYTVLGDRPRGTDPGRFTRFVHGLIVLTAVAIFVALWSVYVVGRALDTVKGVPPLLPAKLPVLPTAALVLGPWAAWLVVGHRFLRKHARAEAETIRGLLGKHVPLLRVFVVVLAVAILGTVGSRGLGPLILLHVSMWYVFTCHMLKNRPASQRPGNWWQWFRTTATGFRVLHITPAVALLVLALLGTYGAYQQGWLSYLFSAEMFYFWTVVHITTSFLPR